MAIDPMSEEVFTLAEAARRLPRLRRGRPVDLSTLYRWAGRGLRGVRLETLCVGGTRVTGARALRESCERLGRARAATAAGPVPPPTRADRRVEEELDRLGLGEARGPNGGPLRR
jgi:hypothetical protein